MKEKGDEEVVWFCNPSKAAARARREKAKDVMGRELWYTIMEDSSDEEADGDEAAEEQFYFYDGGWHSHPQPQVHHPESTSNGDLSLEEVDSQGFEVGEDCSQHPKDVAYSLENSDQSVNNYNTAVIVRVCVSQSSKDVEKLDVNGASDDRYSLESVEDVPKPDGVVVKIEIPNEKESWKTMPEQVETAQEKENIKVVASEHTGTQEQQRGLHNHVDDNDVAVSCNDADMELRLKAETQTKSAVVDVDVAEEESPIDASNQVVAVSMIESMFESNEHSSGGFKHKIIRGWTRCVRRKIRGWYANIRRALTPCCINTNTETTQ